MKSQNAVADSEFKTFHIKLHILGKKLSVQPCNITANIQYMSSDHLKIRKLFSVQEPNYFINCPNKLKKIKSEGIVKKKTKTTNT